jgi:PST family polysaccharide transporter
VSSWRPSFKWLDKSSWSVVISGGHITLFNFAQYVTMTFDNILVAATFGAGALGLYDKAYKAVSQPLNQLLGPATRIAIRVLVRFLGEPDSYRSAYTSMLQSLLVLATPGILFVLIMAEPLMFLLLGPRWLGVAPIISWFCLGGLASTLSYSAGWLFISQGRADRQLRYGAATSVLSAVCFAAGLPWGAVGVAAGAGLSFLLLATPLTCWGATRAGPVKLMDMLMAIVPILIASIATVAALLAARSSPAS